MDDLLPNKNTLNTLFTNLREKKYEKEYSKYPFALFAAFRIRNAGEFVTRAGRQGGRYSFREEGVVVPP